MGMKFDLVLDNPFRVLSVGANADSAQIDDAVDYILDEISLFGGEGQALDYDLAEFSLPDRSAESISKYRQMLQQDGDYYRMFWFVSPQYTKTWHEYADINQRLAFISQGPNANNYDAFLSVVLFAIKNIQNDSVMAHVWPSIFNYLRGMSDDSVLLNVLAPRYANAQIAVLKRGFADLKQACVRVLSDLSHFDYVLKGYKAWNESEVIKELKEEILAYYIEQLTQLSSNYLDNNIPIDAQAVKTVETQKFEYGLYQVVSYLDKLNNTLKNAQVKELLAQVNASLTSILFELGDAGKVQEKETLIEKAKQANSSVYHVWMTYDASHREDWDTLLVHVQIGIHAGSSGCVSDYLYYLNDVLEDSDKTIEVAELYLEEYKRIAAYHLGSAYDKKGDYEKAEYYWKMSIGEGHAGAALQLAIMYDMPKTNQAMQMSFTESSKNVMKYFCTSMHLAPQTDRYFDDYTVHELKERSPQGVAWIAAAFRHLELCNGNPDPKVLAKLREKYIQYNPVAKKYRIDGEGLRAAGRSIMEAVSYGEDAFWASIYDFSIMAQMIPQGINRLMQNPSGDEKKDMLRLAYLYTCKGLVHVQDLKTDLDDCERIYQYIKRVDELDDGSDSWFSRMLLKWKDDVEERIALLKELLIFKQQYPDEADFIILEYCDYACNPKNSPVKTDVSETADLYKKISLCTDFDAEEIKLEYSKTKNYKVLEAFKKYLQHKDVSALMRNVMPILQGKYKGLEIYDRSNEEINRTIITITEKVNQWTKNIEDNIAEHQRDYIGQPDEELRIILLNEWVIRDIEPYVFDVVDSGLMILEYIDLLIQTYNKIYNNAFLCYQEAFVKGNPGYAGSARTLDELAYDGSRYFKAAILSAKYLVLGDYENTLKASKPHLGLGYSNCTFSYIVALVKLGKDWKQVFELCNEHIEADPVWMNYYLMLAAEALEMDPIPYGIQSINAGEDCLHVVLPKLSWLYRQNNDWDNAVIYAAKNIIHFPDDPNAYNDNVLNMLRAFSPSTIEWIAAAYRQVQLTKPEVETYAVNLLASEGLHYNYDTGTFSAGENAFYKLIQAEIFNFAFFTDEYERIKEEYHEKYNKKDFDDCHKGFYMYERSMFGTCTNFEEDFHTCFMSWIWLMLYETSDVDEQHLRFIENWKIMLKRRLAKMWEIVNIKMVDSARAYQETIEFYKNVKCLFGKDAGVNVIFKKIEFYEAYLAGTKIEDLSEYVEYMENYRKPMTDILGVN